MADNVAITAGTGTTIAADEVTDGTLGTVKVQYVKIMSGTIDGTDKAAVSAAGLKVDLGADNDVTVSSISAGTNVIGGVFPVDSNDTRMDPIGPSTIFRSIDIDESEEEVKATAGTLYWLHAVNLTASKLYLKFYNATAANVTVGTTTPVMTFVVPTLGDTNGAGFTMSFGAGGTTFSTAISVACTTGLADNDTGAPAANACVINLGYA